MSQGPVVSRWDRPEAASEPAIRAALHAEGLSAYAWSNGPGDRYASHTHSYGKVLYCVRGAITFEVEGAALDLAAGDRLDLPAGMAHGAVVGPGGCTCLEAHR
jgi:quercetin dioxygenase-like cupin family protein